MFLKQKKFPVLLNAGVSSGDTVRYSVQIGKRDYDIFFRTPDSTLYSGVEPILVLSLLPAMRLAADIHITGPIRTELSDNLHRYMGIIEQWYRDFSRINISGKTGVDGFPGSRNRVGLFFTGGVDSFYSLLKRKDEITDLIYVHGFDVELGDHARRKAVSDMCRSVAGAFGKGLVEVETNARRLLKGYTHWGRHGHGPALASVGHILSSEFRRIYIAASRLADALIISTGFNPPWGSHPDTDPLLGDSTIDLIHDGYERRPEKIEAICDNEVVMDHLRVCWTNVEGAYNCGRCEKCLRTMLTLHTLGKLKGCRTLPDTIEPADIRSLLLERGRDLERLRENLLLLITRGQQDSPICSAVREIALRPAWRTNMLITIQKTRSKARKLIFSHQPGRQ